MNPKYLSKSIYDKAKRIADDKYKTHSAYKSAFILKTYKELGGKIDESKSKQGLRKWIKEDWKNLTPFVENLGGKRDFSCGEKHPKQKNPSICRPLKDVDKYTKEQLTKAVKIKASGKNIDWKTI